jgi:hypothetical protein
VAEFDAVGSIPDNRCKFSGHLPLFSATNISRSEERDFGRLRRPMMSLSKLAKLVGGLPYQSRVRAERSPMLRSLLESPIHIPALPASTIAAPRQGPTSARSMHGSSMLGHFLLPSSLLTLVSQQPRMRYPTATEPARRHW